MDAIRKALREKFGPRKYRISKSGEIHAFGVMPNTHKTGWYLLGYVGQIQI